MSSRAALRRGLKRRSLSSLGRRRSFPILSPKRREVLPGHGARGSSLLRIDPARRPLPGGVQRDLRERRGAYSLRRSLPRIEKGPGPGLRSRERASSQHSRAIRRPCLHHGPCRLARKTTSHPALKARPGPRLARRTRIAPRTIDAQSERRGYSVGDVSFRRPLRSQRSYPLFRASWGDRQRRRDKM